MIGSIPRTFAVVLIFFAGCAVMRPLVGGDLTGAEITRMTEDQLSKSGSVASKSFHEACLKLESGHSLEYSFSASQPVHFNIHYHQGKEAIYPVSLKDVVDFKATFHPADAQHYCLMWSNPHSGPAELTYRMHLDTQKD